MSHSVTSILMKASIEEVHAQLFQLLITGRASPAIAEWLGNRLTGRVSQSVQDHGLISRLLLNGNYLSRRVTRRSRKCLPRVWDHRSNVSFFCWRRREVGVWCTSPSILSFYTLCETVLINRSSYAKLGLHTDAVEQSLAVAVGFAKLIERMRQQAQEEMYAASEWIKWLRYGMFTSPFLC